MKNLFVTLLLLSVTGCGINCIEGSQGISGSSVIIEVPPTAEMKSGKLQPNWIDTGLRINADQTMKLTIDGALNMCPKDFFNPKEVIVPAASCANVNVDYKDESIYDNMESTCGSRLSGRTVSVFTLNSGDIFRVSLVPRKVRVTDCSSDALKDLGIIYYSDNEIFEDESCESPVEAQSVCQHGIKKFYMKVENECKFFGGISAIPRLQGTEVSALVDNTNTPYGNKILYTKNSGDGWIKTHFIYDARTIKFSDVKKLKDQCEVIKELNDKKIIGYINANNPSQLSYYKEQKKKGIINSEVTEDTIYAINNFTVYDINCICGTICGSKEYLDKFDMDKHQKSHGSTKNAIGTLLYSNLSGGCGIVSDYKEGMTEEEINKEINGSKRIIQGLSAFFTQKNAKDSNARFECFPAKTQGSNCYNTLLYKPVEENSIQSDFNYVYNKNSPATLSFVILGRTGKYAQYSGGYNIHVEHICNFRYGKKLYIYIGDNPPTMLPGDNNTTELFVPDPDSGGDDKLGTSMYVINEDGSNKKSGKIYLGIDVRGYEDQFDYTSLPEIESENKYSVNFFIKQWNPNFSKAFVMLRNSLLWLLYGLPKNSEVKDISEAMNIVHEKKLVGAVQRIYTNQTTAGSLWRAVQALCTLYIIFTVLGYVIGIIKCTKYDLGIRIAKIAIIVGLLSQGSWEFFSSHFFSLFLQGVSDLISAFSGELDGDSAFAFLDPTIGVLLTGEVWIRLLTLIITGPIGWVVFCMILWAFFAFFVCIIESVIAYLFTIVGVAFLGTLAPIFITFILFQFTKTLFDSWVKMLVNFSLQPIILFAALAFLNQVVVTTLHDVVGFTVCNQCLVGLDLPSSVTEEGAPHDICLLPLLSPVGYSSDLSMTDAVREEQFRGGGLFFGLPFGITSVLILLIAANAMRAFKGMSENIAHSISGSISGLGASVHGAAQALASVVGLDQETQSIIQNAIKNRKSTGKSDVNIVSRSSANPSNVGERVKEGNSDNTGSGLDAQSYDGKSQTGSLVASGDGDHGDQDEIYSRLHRGGLSSMLPPNNSDVLDTASSTYRTSTDSYAIAQQNAVNDSKMQSGIDSTGYRTSTDSYAIVQQNAVNDSKMQSRVDSTGVDDVASVRREDGAERNDGDEVT